MTTSDTPETAGQTLRRGGRKSEDWYPSKAEQAMAATKAIELYDQICAMCGDHKGCPAPFDEIYRELLKHRFTLEKLRHV